MYSLGFPCFVEIGFTASACVLCGMEDAHEVRRSTIVRRVNQGKGFATAVLSIVCLVRLRLLLKWVGG